MLEQYLFRMFEFEKHLTSDELGLPEDYALPNSAKIFGMYLVSKELLDYAGEVGEYYQGPEYQDKKFVSVVFVFSRERRNGDLEYIDSSYRIIPFDLFKQYAHVDQFRGKYNFRWNNGTSDR